MVAGSAIEVAAWMSKQANGLPKPLDMYCDAYIDDLEVDEGYRRKGIASRQLSMT